VEVRAALEYNFDLHVEGNHAPFVFVAHTHVYVSSYDDNAAGTADQRRVAIEDFLAYALAKTETRMVPLRDVVEWMRGKRPPWLGRRRGLQLSYGADADGLTLRRLGACLSRNRHLGRAAPAVTGVTGTPGTRTAR